MWFKIFGLNQAKPICNFEGKEYFGDYYLGTNHTEGILARFGVPFEINLLCFFEIIRKGNFFILRRKRIQEGKIYSKYKIAGNNPESAKHFMIEEILRMTMPNRYEDPLDEVKKALSGAI